MSLIGMLFFLWALICLIVFSYAVLSWLDTAEHPIHWIHIQPYSSSTATGSGTGSGSSTATGTGTGSSTDTGTGTGEIMGIPSKRLGLASRFSSSSSSSSSSSPASATATATRKGAIGHHSFFKKSKGPGPNKDLASDALAVFREAMQSMNINTSTVSSTDSSSPGDQIELTGSIRLNRSRIRSLFASFSALTLEKLDELASWFRNRFSSNSNTTENVSASMESSSSVASASTSSALPTKSKSIFSRLNPFSSSGSRSKVASQVVAKGPSVYGKKGGYAILVGQGYYGTEYELGDICIHDIRAYLNLLTSRYGYKRENIIVLTDDPNPAFYNGCWQVLQPTRANLISALTTYNARLLTESKRNTRGTIESNFIYSGHGSNQLTNDWNELDNMMECIIMKDGPFWDVEFYQRALAPLPNNCRQFCMFDACMSGTMTNLPYIFNLLSKSMNQCSTNFTTKAQCMAISGCQDQQTSSAGYKTTGLSALTGAFLEYLQEKNYLNVGIPELMIQLRKKMRAVNELQIPMWTSSKSDVNWSIC